MLRIFTSWINPSTSAGIEPANLGSWDEHATLIPPGYFSTNCSLVEPYSTPLETFETVFRNRRSELFYPGTMAPSTMPARVEINYWCETSIRAGNLTICRGDGSASFNCTEVRPSSASFTRRMAALRIIETLGCIYASRALFAQSLTSHVVTENRWRHIP